MRTTGLRFPLGHRSYDPLLPETFSYVGKNHFVYTTDIPHWDCEFPPNLQHTQDHKDLPDGTKNKIFTKT